MLLTCAILIILALMQPVCFLLGAWVYYRAQSRQSPAVSFPRKVEVGGDDQNGADVEVTHPKGRPIL